MLIKVFGKHLKSPKCVTFWNDKEHKIHLFSNLCFMNSPIFYFIFSIIQKVKNTSYLSSKTPNDLCNPNENITTQKSNILN